MPEELVAARDETFFRSDRPKKVGAGRSGSHELIKDRWEVLLFAETLQGTLSPNANPGIRGQIEGLLNWMPQAAAEIQQAAQTHNHSPRVKHLYQNSASRARGNPRRHLKCTGTKVTGAEAGAATLVLASLPGLCGSMGLKRPARTDSRRDAGATNCGGATINVQVISAVQLGTLDYASGLRLQQRLIELRKAGRIGDVLLLLEHTPVITLGRNAKSANVLASPEELAARGVEVFECDRGGDVTFHGPGQLVGYPIFDLRGFERSQLSAVSSQGNQKGGHALSLGHKTLGAVDYVRRLEEVLIRTCADFGIATQRVSGLTGVWTKMQGGSLGEDHGGGRGPSTPLRMTRRDGSGQSRADETSLDRAPASEEAKIAAIGVHISRSVTSHGFALNVNTDLRRFDLIVPCGIAAKPVTSMQKELGRDVELIPVAEAVARNFGVVFGRQILWVRTLEALLGNTVGVPVKAPAELREMRGEDETSWA